MTKSYEILGQLCKKNSQRRGKEEKQEKNGLPKKIQGKELHKGARIDPACRVTLWEKK